MSETKEMQLEEREALISIYEGDSSFKQINSETYQYKYGEEEGKSFLLEICWHENYPHELPKINMDMFYNRNISRIVKDKIISILNEEGEQWLGCGMTYTLLECLKDKVEELLAENCAASEIDQQIIGTNHQDDEEDSGEADPDERGTKIGSSAGGGGGGGQKKEQLTKAQKRKQWDRVDNKGNRPRGWDWVDIVKHLSQTGGKAE